MADEGLEGEPAVDPIAWARAEVERLRTAGGPRQGSAVAEVRGLLQFLHLHAPGSALEEGANAALKLGFGSMIIADAARCLEQWIELTEAGILNEQPYEVRARLDAATDLMEQVQQLLDDKQVHPAAPIVLAGAALEEHLRSMVEAGHHPLKGDPGLNNYAAALRTANVLDRQAVKEITAWAGLRNEAAHGHFDDLTRAGCAVDGCRHQQLHAEVDTYRTGLTSTSGLTSRPSGTRNPTPERWSRSGARGGDPVSSYRDGQSVVRGEDRPPWSDGQCPRTPAASGTHQPVRRREVVRGREHDAGPQ